MFCLICVFEVSHIGRSRACWSGKVYHRKHSQHIEQNSLQQESNQRYAGLWVGKGPQVQPQCLLTSSTTLWRACSNVWTWQSSFKPVRNHHDPSTSQEHCPESTETPSWYPPVLHFLHGRMLTSHSYSSP